MSIKIGEKKILRSPLEPKDKNWLWLKTVAGFPVLHEYLSGKWVPFSDATAEYMETHILSRVFGSTRYDKDNHCIEFYAADGSEAPIGVIDTSEFEVSIDTDNYYTKAEVEGYVSEYVSEHGGGSADLRNYYTSSEVDTLLSGKVSVVSGKGLSTNDYTTAEKTKLAGLENYDDSALQTAIDGKVDKESGKSLMTDAERTKLQGIAAGAEVNVQSDWNQTTTTADDYIKNKPTIPSKTSDLTNDSGFTSNAGTITGITMNGTSKGTSGVVDLGTVITAHQDISGKANSSEVVKGIRAYGSSDNLPKNNDGIVTLPESQGGAVESVTLNGVNHEPNSQGIVDLGTIPKGDKGDKGDTLLVDGEFDPVTDIVNGLTESETGKALDAKQGKELREKIMELDAKFQDLASKLSTIAFTNQKPSYNAIDWSLPTYLITLDTTGLANASASASSLNITEGGSCIITVAPDSGKVLQSVSYSVNGGTSQTATIANNQAVITIENITAATTVAISGNAAAPSVIQVTKTAKYGIITGGDTVTAGSQYQATITPNQYFGLKSGNVVVKINNVVATEGTDYTLTIDPSTYVGTLNVLTTGATQALDISVKCAVLLYKGYYADQSQIHADTRGSGASPAVCCSRGRLEIGEDTNTSGKFVIEAKFNGGSMSYQQACTQFWDGATYVTFYMVRTTKVTVNCNDGYIIAGGKVTDSVRISLNADDLANCSVRYYADGDTANGTPIMLFDGTDTNSYILVE